MVEKCKQMMDKFDIGVCGFTECPNWCLSAEKLPDDNCKLVVEDKIFKDTVIRVWTKVSR